MDTIHDLFKAVYAINAPIGRTTKLTAIWETKTMALRIATAFC